MPVPETFVAVTVTVYVTPFVRPESVQGLDAALQVTVDSVPSDGTAVAV